MLKCEEGEVGRAWVSPSTSAAIATWGDEINVSTNVVLGYRAILCDL